jgi:precorrin-2 dehydrogenase/sirohydrochlorin ferrochelatase
MFGPATIFSMPDALFPMFLKLDGRRCVVVGAGAVGESKIEGLMRCRAQVTVVAPEASARVREWAAGSEVVWHQREYVPKDMDGAFVVVAATSSGEVNHAIAADARQRGVLCNVVDDPEYCDFFYPAVVQRGALQIAVSTAGAAPALASRLRKELEEQFGPEYEAWLVRLDQERRQILATVADPAHRRARMEELVSEEAFERFAGSSSHSPEKDPP